MTRYGAVEVDGRPATFSRQDEDLVITPAPHAARRQALRGRGRHFTATPTVVDPDDDTSTAFFVPARRIGDRAQPNFAHRVFPSNDHPRDKASFSFRHRRARRGDRGRQRRARVGTSTRAGPDGVALRPAPADGHRARPARGRRLRRHPARRGRRRAVRDVTPRRLSVAAAPGPRRSVPATWRGCRPRRPLPVRPLRQSLVVDAPRFALETRRCRSTAHAGSRSRRACGSRPWSTSSRTSGSATASRPTSGATCGSTRATRPGTRSSTPRSTASSPRTRGHEEATRPSRSCMRRVYALGDQWRAEFGPVARPASGDARDVLSARTSTSAARSCSTRCARRSATTRSTRSSAPG